MKRLRLGAICAGIAAGLAVSYGVLAHDFSALKDGSGNSIRSGFSECVESSGTAGKGADCAKMAAATAAAPAAMADKKEMAATDKKEMADKGDAAAAASTKVASADAAGAGGKGHLGDGQKQSVRTGAGGCVHSGDENSGVGCDAAVAGAPAAAPMADKKEMAPAAAAATAAAGGATALGNHQVGEATHGHLADGQKMPVRTGFGGCVNLGYSVNSPDHPADCAFQATKPVAAAPAAAPAPAKPAPAAARAVPPAPPAVVPGTVRNTAPIDSGAPAAAMADAGVPDSSGEFPATSRKRSSTGALIDDSQAPADAPMAKAPAAPPTSVPGTVRNTGPAGDTAAAEPAPDSELKDSPPPPPIPAPPTQIVRKDSGSMEVPPPAKSQDSGASAAPAAPPADVPGTVRNTAPSNAAASGDVQMPAAKPAPIPAPEYEKISLSADVLFKFDRYREKDMLPAGRAKLDDVADKINNYIKDTVEGIALTGHTDRLGSDAYNQRLSERRAKTVKNYLVKKGVDGSKITDEGRGEREPVVQCKGNKATKKLIRCLQPNRRVDVEIRGAKQK
jgi:outer membrane protein OmpA-like peptidoglycan-associated protein